VRTIYRLILCLALLCSPAWATWTLTQVKDKTACSGTTCAVTVTSTGAGHLLIAGFSDSTSHVQTISSVTAGACAGSWVHCPNCAINATGDGSIDFSYCTNSASGITSITITTSLTMGTGIGVIWEASSSLGTIAIDSGAAPSGTKTDTTCTSCAGVSLTLSGNNDFIAALSANGGAGTGLTGTGWTNDLANPSGDGVAHGITSGSQTAPATWTQSSGTLLGNAIAFQETSGGGATCTPTMALMGVGSCG
jgi:hypothetical protein